MEALLVHTLGDPSTPPSPSPSPSPSPIMVSKGTRIPEVTTPTSVKIKVTAASLNYANYLQIQGKYQEKPTLPFIPGSDYSGIVVDVGNKVDKFIVGDRVCSVADSGSFAQFLVADQSQLFKVPDGCDMLAAAALPVAYGTSHVALLHRAGLKRDQVLLVLGAAGGVGLAAVQIGKVCGAIVIAVARGPEKVKFLKLLGVAHVVDTSESDIIPNVKEFLKSRKLKGVDVLYDPVGGKLAKDALKLLNWGANILIIGFASGDVPIIPANLALVKNWTVHGLYLGSYRFHRPSVFESSLKQVLSWFATGLISINISHSYSLAEAHLAFAAIKNRKAIGKVVVALDHSKVTLSKL